MSVLPLPIDLDAVQRWMAANVAHDGDAGRAPSLHVSNLPSSGASNLILRLGWGDQQFVLRCPPPGQHLMDKRSRTMVREFTLLTALDQTGVPHPRAVACCTDASVIGVCFYLMELIDGFAFMDPLPQIADAQWRHDAVREMVDRLADIATVDWKAVGLSDFGHPDGYLARQVERWIAQAAGYKVRPLPHLADIAGWLRDNLPPSPVTGIVHGDYQCSNLLYAHESRPRVAAVVDWELATIGDPLLDLGWLVAGWSQADDSAPMRPTAAILRDRTGLPSREDLVQRYALRTGFDVSALDFYCVLALYRMACSIEGFYAMSLAGKTDSPHHALFEEMVPSMLALAWDLATAAARQYGSTDATVANTRQRMTVTIGRTT